MLNKRTSEECPVPDGRTTEGRAENYPRPETSRQSTGTDELGGGEEETEAEIGNFVVIHI